MSLVDQVLSYSSNVSVLIPGLFLAVVNGTDAAVLYAQCYLWCLCHHLISGLAYFNVWKIVEKSFGGRPESALYSGVTGGCVYVLIQLYQLFEHVSSRFVLPFLSSGREASRCALKELTRSPSVASGSSSIGNNIGPQTLRAKDLTNYRPAKLAIMDTQTCYTAVTIFLYVYHRWRNARRDMKSGGAQTGGGSFSSKEIWSTGKNREVETLKYSY
jgi:hypothetical protein